MSTHNIPFFQYIKENQFKFSQICGYRIFSKGLKNEFETGMVNEPTVFEPLKFYCTFFSNSKIDAFSPKIEQPRNLLY